MDAMGRHRATLDSTGAIGQPASMPTPALTDGLASWSARTSLGPWYTEMAT